jgi:hypothetical protein
LYVRSLASAAGDFCGLGCGDAEGATALSYLDHGAGGSQDEVNSAETFKSCQIVAEIELCHYQLGYC